MYIPYTLLFLSFSLPGLILTLRCLRPPRGGSEVLFLSLLLSLIIQFYLLVLLGFFNIISRINILILLIIFNYLIYKGGLFNEIKGANLNAKELLTSILNTNIYLKILSLYICLIMFFGFYHSAFFPVYSWDGIVNNKMAKRIFTYSGYNKSIPDISWICPISFNMAWVYVILGQIDEYWAHLVHFLYALILLFYTYKLALCVSADGTMAVFFVTVFPSFVWYLHSSFMDIPFTALLMATLYYFHKVISGKRSYIPLLGLLNGTLVIAKPHGLFFLIIPFYVLVKYYNKHKSFKKSALHFSQLFIIVLLISVTISMIDEKVHKNYYYKLFMGHSPNPRMWELSVTKRAFEAGKDLGLFSKPVMGLVNLGWSEKYGKYSGVAISSFLITFTLLPYLFSRHIPLKIKPLYHIGILYFLVWLFMYSYAYRYAIHWLPIFSIISSYNFNQIVKPRFRSVLFALMIIYLLPSMYTSMKIVMWGKTAGGVGGPYLTWALSNSFLSIEEKSEILLGDMYRSARFVNQDARFIGSRIGVFDARQSNYIQNAETRFITVNSLSNIDDLDYLILPNQWVKHRYQEQLDSGEDIISDDLNLIDITNFGDFYIYKKNNSLVRGP